MLQKKVLIDAFTNSESLIDIVSVLADPSEKALQVDLEFSKNEYETGVIEATYFVFYARSFADF